MQYGLRHTLSRLAAGQTLARIMMNVALSEEVIKGKVADIGGARNPDYFTYLRKDGVTMVDAIDGSISGIDFETDALPYPDASVDTVISCNVLEHIYNHSYLLSEMLRITVPGGRLVGFVPFWVGYHPDPKDYFRYTEGALRRMLTDAGYVRCLVRAVGGGPFLGNFNTIVLSVPRFVRPMLYLPYALTDATMLALRPESRKRNPLGYVFTAERSA